MSTPLRRRVWARTTDGEGDGAETTAIERAGVVEHLRNMPRPARTVGVLAVVAIVAAICAVVIARSSSTDSVSTATYDWPTYLGNISRTSASEDPRLTVANAPTLDVSWATMLGGPIASSATVVSGRLYIGAWDGNEYALDATTGTIIWKTFLGVTNDSRCNPAKLGVTSAPTVQDGVVYVGGGDSYWYALDAATGTILWKVYTGPSDAGAHYNWSSPLLYDGYAYIGVASNCDVPLVQGHLLKVDLTTHQIVGDYKFVPDGQIGGGIWTSPSVDAHTNTIFVSTGTLNDHTQTQSQAMVAIDATTFTYKDSWQLPHTAAVTDSDWGTSPTLITTSSGNQLVGASNKNGVFYAFDRNNLAAGPVWQHKLALGGDCPVCGDGTVSSAAFAHGRVYVAGGKSVSDNGLGSGGSIRALDATTGAASWIHPTRESIIGAPVYVNGLVAAVAGAMFDVLDATTGSQLYTYLLPGPAYGAVSVANGQFYVGAADGRLFSFSPGAKTKQGSSCPSGLTCPAAPVESPPGSTTPLRFFAKAVSGDSELRATLAPASDKSADEAGLMIRQRGGASPYYAVLADPNDPGALVVEYRNAFEGDAVVLARWPRGDKALSLLVRREGDLFSAAVSTDGGATYVLVPGTTAYLDFPDMVLEGVAVPGKMSSKDSAGPLTNISIGRRLNPTVGRPGPAHPCPPPWACTDIGNPTGVGDTTGTGRSMNLAGVGTGIAGVSDKFHGAYDSVHYVYQSVSGNQTTTARVRIEPSGPATAQAGLMMRLDTGPTSPYYAMLFDPGGGVTVAWRVHDGVQNNVHVVLPKAVPTNYIGIARYADPSLTSAAAFFSAMTSSDGVSWTPVLGSTVAIDMGAGPYLTGVAATAGAAPAKITPATFDAITIGSVMAPTPGICPGEFACSDIGLKTFAGNQVFVDDQWTLQSSGADMFSNFDSFRFAYQEFPVVPVNSKNRDGTVGARVVAYGAGSDEWMKSGVMIRSGTDAQAPYYGVFVTPKHGVVVQSRATTAAQTQQVAAVTLAAPVWVLASRYTDPATNTVYFSAFTSSDGRKYTLIPGSTQVLDLPGDLFAGLATDSHNAGALASVTFDEVAQLGGSPPPSPIPVTTALCPAGWQCADIGTSTPPGTQTASNVVWTVQGGGPDIFGLKDGFHYVWQAFPGNGSLSAKINAQTTHDPWAKAGVMFRASPNEDATYYAIYLTGGNGIVVQSRDAVGHTATEQAKFAGDAPIYLRITKAGPAFSAATSRDGVTWNVVPESRITVAGLAGALLAGVAVSSHDVNGLSTVTFSAVTLG